MTTISILRDQVQSTRTSLLNAAAVKASKRKFKLSPALDLIVEFLDKEYHRKYVDWRNNVELLIREEKKGWG